MRDIAKEWGVKTSASEKAAGGMQPPGYGPNAPPLAVAPFDAAKAKEHQKARADYLGVPVEMANSIGMKFAAHPAGRVHDGSE